MCGKSPFSGKKVLSYKKTGIVKAKKYKNRIYLRKKGDDKNRKKKDFFPPNQCECRPRSSEGAKRLETIWEIQNYVFPGRTVSDVCSTD